MSFDVNRNFERLEQYFDIKRDGSIILPVDEYTTWSANASLQTASYRNLSVESSLEFGEFWSGNRFQYDVKVTLRPLPGLDFSSEYIRTDIKLEEGPSPQTCSALKAIWILPPPCFYPVRCSMIT